MENNFPEKDKHLRPPKKGIKHRYTSNFYSVSGMIHLLSPFTNYIEKPKDFSRLAETNVLMILILPSSQKPYNQI